jgi:hypothetical protein
MQITKINKDDTIKHVCKTLGICRFAINRDDYRKFNSKTTQYHLICQQKNKEYLIPAEFVKQYVERFKGNGVIVPLPIDPNTDQVKYQGRSQSIKEYCLTGKNKIASVIQCPPSIEPTKFQNFEINKDKKSEHGELAGEQKEIIETIKKEITNLGDGWNKYKGNMVAQIIIEFLKKYLPANLTIVGHNYFIYNYPTEFDALIVKTNAQTHYNSYEPNDVIVAIEIKQSGFRSDDEAKSQYELFIKLRRKFPNIKCLLIVANCTHPKQIRRFQQDAYILSGSNWSLKKYVNAWENLIDLIKKL